MTSANLGGGGELIGDYENRESETIQQTALKNILIMQKKKNKVKLNPNKLCFNKGGNLDFQVFPKKIS